jgi:hypothetical protein
MAAAVPRLSAPLVGPVTRLLVVTLAVLSAAPAAGQDAAPELAGRPAQLAGIGQAPVSVDGEVLFTVRGILAFPAAGRASQIAKRIRALASRPLRPHGVHGRLRWRDLARAAELGSPKQPDDEPVEWAVPLPGQPVP